MKSWNDIRNIVRNGKAADVFTLGEQFPVRLSDGSEIVFEAAAIDLYGRDLILVMKDCLPLERCLHGQRIYSENEGWKNCDMRRWLHDTILPRLPDELRGVIAPRAITQSVYGKTYTCEDQLWIPSQSELFADFPDEADAGDAHFPLYRDAQSRVKTRAGVPAWYWLRTPYAAYAYAVRRVNPDGELYNHYANLESGIAFAFMIA